MLLPRFGMSAVPKLVNDESGAINSYIKETTVSTLSRLEVVRQNSILDSSQLTQFVQFLAE
jgi:hypothetical protein